MNRKRRLVGIDLLKGVAAYAVVFIHSLGGPFGNTGFWAEKIGLFFTGFAVPFFLATSFYLMAQKLYCSNSPYSLKSRLKNILTPYLIWTLIYLLFRTIKCLVIGDYQKISLLFSDPISILFFGGAAVQLYFIPLLMTGTIAILIDLQTCGMFVLKQ